MPKTKLIFALAFLVAYPVAFVFTRHMEAIHKFDSIGLWYSLYVAAFFACGAAVIVLTAVLAIAWASASRRRIRREG
jgi:hypothetical protein